MLGYADQQISCQHLSWKIKTWKISHITEFTFPKVLSYHCVRDPYSISKSLV